MPSKWTASEHEELLIHVLQTHKLDYHRVVANWKQNNPGSAPTHSGLTQHIDKWTKARGVTKSKSPAKVLATPRTPKTPRVPAAPTVKTPASGTKRKASRTSDDDESDLDITADVGIRSSLPRRSKSAQPNFGYVDAASDDEEEDQESMKAGENVNGTGKTVNGPHTVANGTEKPARKIRAAAVDSDSESDSDGSDFAKAFA